jgi:hypothetical protein
MPLDFDSRGNIMKNLIYNFSVFIAAFVIYLPQNTLAEMTAREIMQKLERISDSVVNIRCNMTSDIDMAIIDKEGKKLNRKVRYFSKCKEDEKLMLAFFLHPPDVRNIGFLSHDYNDPKKEDRRWLYMPSLKKVRRVVSSDDSQSLMGLDIIDSTDFSFSTDPEDYDCEFYKKKEMEIDGVKIWAIEMTPLKKEEIDKTGYKKHFFFVRQDNYDLFKLISFDKNNEYRNVISFRDPKLIDGIKLFTEMSIKKKKNNKTIKHLITKFSNTSFKQDLNDKLFTLRRLKKGL